MCLARPDRLMVGAFDAVCLGESMVLVVPDPPRPLAAAGPVRLDVAGAESTVACYLAQLGARAAWISRVGDDPLGALVRHRVGGYGVDVSLIEVDPLAPTGVFFKDPGGFRDPAGTAVYYYRQGSAASRMHPGVLAHPALHGCRVIHLSGITAALSPSCAGLVRQALAGPGTGGGPGGAVRSFDVNYRPALWSPEVAGPVLAELANAADVVFVGLDEARTLWNTSTADQVREAVLPVPGLLVVKDGPVGATSYGPAGATFAAALPVDVREPVGAGDAFAAGYLFGLLRGLAEPARLRLGHLIAGEALGVSGDVAPLPHPALLLDRARREQHSAERRILP